MENTRPEGTAQMAEALISRTDAVAQRILDGLTGTKEPASIVCIALLGITANLLAGPAIVPGDPNPVTEWRSNLASDITEIARELAQAQMKYEQTKGLRRLIAEAEAILQPKS